MSLIFISFICAILYLVSSAVQATTLTGSRTDHNKLVMGTGVAAVLIHTLAVYIVLHPGNGIQLGFFPVSSLIAWLIAGLVLISSPDKTSKKSLRSVIPTSRYYCSACCTDSPDSSFKTL